MAVGDAYVFSGFLTPVLTQLFFPKPPTTFLTRFCRGERRKYAGKKVRSKLPGHQSETITTEPPGRGTSPVLGWDCEAEVSCLRTLPQNPHHGIRLDHGASEPRGTRERERYYFRYNWVASAPIHAFLGLGLPVLSRIFLPKPLDAF